MADTPSTAEPAARPEWTMSDERVLTLTLINQRINFFLVFFSAVVAGTFSARSQLQIDIILSIGVALCWVMTLVIFRTETRLQVVLSHILQDKDHPYTVSQRSVGMGRRVQPIMGFIVPSACSSLLTVGAILALLHVFHL